MLNRSIQKALNEHLNAELRSSYLYLSMSAYLKADNLPGLAHWMNSLAKQEADHAMRLYRYLVDRQACVRLANIQGPATEWKSPASVFQLVLEYEMMITCRINNLVVLVEKEKDLATSVMLPTVVKDQMKEEAMASAIVQEMARIGDTRSGLMLIDRALGNREDLNLSV